MEKIYHRGVYGIVINAQRELLVVKKARGPYIGKYDLPGGRLEADETDEQALRREIYEETGVVVKHVQFLKEFERTVIYNYRDEMRELEHTISLWEITEYKMVTLKVIETDLDVSDALWLPLHVVTHETITPAVAAVAKLQSF